MIYRGEKVDNKDALKLNIPMLLTDSIGAEAIKLEKGSSLKLSPSPFVSIKINGVEQVLRHDS